MTHKTPLPIRQTNTFRSLVFTLIAAIISELAYGYLAVTIGGWQLIGLAVLDAILCVAIVAGLAVVQRGQLALANWLVVLAGDALVLYAGVSIANMGVILGLSFPLLIGLTVFQAVPQATAQRITFSSLVAGGLALGFDLLSPAWQLALPAALESFLPLILASLLIAYALILARQFNNFSLRTKLLIAFLTVTVVSIGAVTLINNRLIRDRLTTEAGTNLKTLAASRGQTIGDLLARETDLLQAFALNTAVHDFAAAASRANTRPQSEITTLDRQWRFADVNNNNADPLVQSVLNNSLTDELLEFQTAFPENLDLLITDNRSVNIAASRREVSYFHSNEGWWRTAFNSGTGQVYIGPPTFDPVTGRLVSQIAVPIYGQPTGELVGIVSANYNLEVLSSILASTAPVGSGLIFPGGQFLQIGGGIAQLSPEAQASLESIATFTELIYEGEPSVVSQALITSQDPEKGPAIAALGWTFIVHRPTLSVLATVNTVAQASLLTGTVALIVAALAAILSAQLLTGPITRLTNVAARVTGGDLATQARVEAGDEIGTLATTFNSMTSQLRQTLMGLEQRVAERTAELAQASEKMRYRATQLQTSAEVARTVAAVLDLKELLPQVTSLISERFGFYHVSIFLLDSEDKYALLQAANSEGGKRMLARGHRLLVGQVGIVGYVTGKGEPRIASDVGHDAVYFDNPDLPLTRSEMALPLKVRGQVIGALDVQSTKPAAFAEEDVALLTILADQIAIAIENARSFQQQATLASTNQQLLAEAQKSANQQKALADENQRLLARAESAVQELSQLTRRLTGEAWDKFLPEGRDAFVAEDAAPGAVGAPAHSLARPIVLRGEVIGTLSLEEIDPQRQWSEHDTAILESVADRLALTLDNARLFEDAEQRLAELTVINSLSDVVAAQQNLAELVRTAGEKILQTFGVQNGFIALYDKTTNMIELPFFREGDEIIHIPPVPLGRGLSSVIINTRRPLLINHDAERRAAELGAMVVGQLPRSFLGVPIIVGEEVVGVISVQSLQREGLFTEANVRLLSTIAATVGIGLQNARLFTETRRLAQRETRINAITRKLRASQTVESILETAARELGQALRAPQVVIEVKGDANLSNAGGNGHAPPGGRIV